MKIASKIITIKQAREVSKQVKLGRKTIVLVGGCFDILHPGHKEFLTQAKKLGDVLFVALENDITIKRLKGQERPINQQEKRAAVLSKINEVDYVILLPTMYQDSDYFQLVQGLAPDIIGVTDGDPQLRHKQEQAKQVGGKIVVVTSYFPEYSTTKLIHQDSQSYSLSLKGEG